MRVSDEGAHPSPTLQRSLTIGARESKIPLKSLWFATQTDHLQDGAYRWGG